MLVQSRFLSLMAFGAAMTSIAILSIPVVAAEKWDMPAAYSAKNYVSSSYIKFADMVNNNSNGELEVVVHPSGSLYKGSEIFRAVRTGQVPIGGRYMGAHASEDSIFGLDTVPFIATDIDQAMKLYEWFLPLLRLDTVPKFVQLIKLVQEAVAMGSARVRPPRLELEGEELISARYVIDTALKARPKL